MAAASARSRRGESFSVADLCRAHADLMPEIEEQLRALQIVARARPQSDIPDSTGTRTATSIEDETSDGSEFTSLPLVPGYQLLRRIGAGGQGVVYEGVQQSTGQRVAIKFVHLADPDGSGRQAERFRREIRALGQLKHPAIASVLDSGVHLGRPYCVLEYVDGLPLDEHLAATVPPTRAVVELVVQITRAIAESHLRGIIHRDLKPTNILVTDDGRPHLLDFGLARLTDESWQAGQYEGSLTQTGQFVGSMRWASPEQSAGLPEDVDARTDVYSLGVILYEAIAGQPPYALVGDLAARTRTIRFVPPNRAGLSASGAGTDLQAIVLKCLAKPRADRYQTANALTEDLTSWLEHRPISARPPGAWTELRYLVRRNRGLAWSAGLVASALIVGLVGLTVGLSRARAAQKLAEVRERQARTAEAAAADSQTETEFQLYVATISAAQGAIASNDTRTAIEQLRTSPAHLRGWEWRHLAAKANQSTASRRLAAQGGWSGGVFDFAVSPDESVIAATVNRKACLLDSASLDVLEECATPPGYSYAWFAAPGKLLIAGEHRRLIDTKVRWRDSPGGATLFCHPYFGSGAILCDGASGEQLQLVDEPKTKCAALSPEGERVAIGTTEAWIHVHLVSPDTLQASYRVSTPGFAEIKWHPDGHTVAAVSHHRPVLVWNVDADEVVAEVDIPGTGTTVCFSPDGRELAIGLLGGQIARWDLIRKRTIQILSGPSGDTHVMEYSRDGSVLWVGADDASIYRFELSPNTIPETLSCESHSVQAIIEGSEGLRVLVCTTSEAIHVVEVASRRVTQSLRVPGERDRGVVATTDGRTIVSAHQVRGTSRMGLRRWDLETGRSVQILEHPIQLAGGRAVMRMIPDGSAVAVLVPSTHGETSMLVDPQSGRIVRGPDAPRFSIRGIGPTGEIAGQAGGDPFCRVYADTSALLAGQYQSLPFEFDADGLGPHIMAVSQSFVIGATDPRIFLWDKATGSLLTSIPGTHSETLSLAITPDESRFIMMCEDGLVRIHELPSGRPVATLRGGASWSFGQLSPDGRVWMTAGPDHTVRFWEAPTTVMIPSPWSPAEIGP